MPVDFSGLLDELRQESDHLLGILSVLDFEQWGLATPSPGWAIQDQVTHLAYFDDATLTALQRPGEFRALADALMAEGMDFPDRIAENHRILAPETMLSWLRDSRTKLLHALAEQDPKSRLPWFGPEMSAASCATARLMETWAHGQDIYDALGVAHPPSPGLRSIAHLGYATLPFSHQLHGLDIPTEPVRVALAAPGDELWGWGPSDSVNRVCGSADDFVLVVTQRRHWTETGLHVVGPVAQQWMDIAQAFAGAPSRRRPTVTP